MKQTGLHKNVSLLQKTNKYSSTQDKKQIILIMKNFNRHSTITRTNRIQKCIDHETDQCKHCSYYVHEHQNEQYYYHILSGEKGVRGGRGAGGGRGSVLEVMYNRTESIENLGVRKLERSSVC